MATTIVIPTPVIVVPFPAGAPDCCCGGGPCPCDDIPDTLWLTLVVAGGTDCDGTYGPWEMNKLADDPQCWGQWSTTDPPSVPDTSLRDWHFLMTCDGDGVILEWGNLYNMGYSHNAVYDPFFATWPPCQDENVLPIIGLFCQMLDGISVQVIISE